MAVATELIQENAVEIADLVRRYGKTEAVDGLSFTVRTGSCYGLFGRNGSGKTTTLKCLLNHLRPGSGSVRIFGMDPGRDEVAVKARLTDVPEMPTSLHDARAADAAIGLPACMGPFSAIASQ